ncbi:MAG: hypothetical protein IH996_06500 [Proteobacteria bacterium]|nr:hypothetical protein [Pseudomonadota bacterium]
MTFEASVAAIANYVERLREQIGFYTRELISRYEATSQALDPAANKS